MEDYICSSVLLLQSQNLDTTQRGELILLVEAPQVDVREIKFPVQRSSVHLRWRDH